MSEAPNKILRTPVRLEYTVTAGRNYTRYLRALARRQIIGARCDRCCKVYVPPRGACPRCGIPLDAEVALADRGTVTTFCVVNIAFGKMPFDPPYVVASILLDGADIAMLHLVRGIPTDQVRMGMRVRAVWVPDASLAPTLESIRWFEASTEPDADYASYEAHL